MNTVHTISGWANINTACAMGHIINCIVFSFILIEAATFNYRVGLVRTCHLYQPLVRQTRTISAMGTSILNAHIFVKRSIWSNNKYN